MSTVTIFVPPIWIAMPPEINTSRLMAGAGPAPMLQAAAGWEVLAIALETQADELMGSLSTLSSLWNGMASERAVTATMPMVIWLRMLSLQAHKRSLQAAAQATSYTTAMATTPQLAEIELNHITHAVLEATNFLEINRLPITLNELDYIRMWDLAATVMDMYQSETMLNGTFEPICPAKPIVMPGVGAAVMGTGLGQAAAMAPAAAARNAVFAQVSGQGKAEEFALNAGRTAQMGNEAANHTRSEATQTRGLGPQQDQMLQQGMQQGVQMATQLGSSLGQLPQQMMQGVTQPFQQLTQPLQQVSAMFGQMGMGGDKGAQVGLMGAAPFSNHPAIGGTGAATGAGLVRAASLPGAGGTSARTPLMSNLVGTPLEPTVSPVSAAVGAAAGASAAGLAPVGSGAGAGGPMGTLGNGKGSGGSKAGLTAPAPLPHDLNEDEEDDW
jgi:PPE-repeat protein